MRVGASIIIKNGIAVQSYNWTLTRPFGSLSTIIKELDEYQCDEIAILRYVRAREPLIDLKTDLQNIGKIASSSPISLGGGIRELSHLNYLTNLPIERVIFSSIFLSQKVHIINELILNLGRQAIQCLLPVQIDNNSLYVLNLEKKTKIEISNIDFSFLEKYANELIIYDTNNDGRSNSFNFEILDKIRFPFKRLVLTGGIGLRCARKAKAMGIASILIENKVLHSEYSIENFKRQK
ncbi:HisA/HisF-related TIM barrel protein [Amylibacter sp.]|nr:HisA/HisF-related TIM barrel protein [Amylibacter sp.]